MSRTVLAVFVGRFGAGGSAHAGGRTVPVPLPDSVPAGGHPQRERPQRRPDPHRPMFPVLPGPGAVHVPVGAKAVSVNLTAVGPAGVGFLTLFPSGITRPMVSSLNFTWANRRSRTARSCRWRTRQSTRWTCLYIPWSAAPGTVHMVLDVTGYFQ